MRVSPSGAPMAGRWVLAGKEGEAQLYSVSTAGGTPKRLTTGGGFSVGQDGRRTGGVSRFVNLLEGKADIALMKADRSAGRLTDDPLDVDPRGPGRHAAAQSSRGVRALRRRRADPGSRGGPHPDRSRDQRPGRPMDPRRQVGGVPVGRLLPQAVTVRVEGLLARSELVLAGGKMSYLAPQAGRSLLPPIA
jgi:hypothetical protein